MYDQILSTNTISNVWRTVRRTCMLILGLKGLIKGSLSHKRILSAAFDQGLTFVDGVVAGMGTWGRASANGWGGDDISDGGKREKQEELVQYGTLLSKDSFSVQRGRSCHNLSIRPSLGIEREK